MVERVEQACVRRVEQAFQACVRQWNLIWALAPEVHSVWTATEIYFFVALPSITVDHFVPSSDISKVKV
jgi:hypothetical protein